VPTFLGDDKGLVGGVVGVVTFGGGGEVITVRGGRGIEPVLGSFEWGDGLTMPVGLGSDGLDDGGWVATERRLLGSEVESVEIAAAP